MAQQYLPSNYSGSRYSSQTLGVPFQSAYDPNVTGRYAGLMQQEYAKAMSANQAMSAREGEIGDIMSLDPEGKEQVMNAYKERTGKIRESYNNDLALAAPELARAVVEERSNPWYAKNVLYNKEYERKQKLLDQYGPNIQFLKDLPEGNLNNIDQEDIGFDYYNRLHLQQGFEQEFGDYAKQTTNFPLEDIPGYPAFVRGRTQKGITHTDVEALAEKEGQDFIVKSLEGMGLEPTEQNIAQLTQEFRNWGHSSLVGGESVQRMQNPAYKKGTGLDFSALNFTQPPGTFEKGDVGSEDTPSRREAVEEGLDILQQDPDNMLSEAFVNNLDRLTSGQLDGVAMETTIDQLVRASKRTLRGAANIEGTIIKILKGNGILEGSGTRKNGAIWMGESIPYEQYRENLEVLKEEFKEVKKYIHNPEAKTAAKQAYAENNLLTETPILGVLPEFSQKASNFFKTSLFSGDPEAMINYGVTIEGKEGKTSKTKNIITDINSGEKSISGVDYVRSSTKGKPGSFKLTVGEDIVNVPMRGKRGKAYAMELSILIQKPTPLNDTFDYIYDRALEEGDNTVPLSDFMGTVLPGFDNIERGMDNGQVVYSAFSQEAGKPIVASTPYDLMLKVANFNYLVGISQGDAGRVNVILENPHTNYLTRVIRENLTPTDIKEMTAQQLMGLIAGIQQ